MRTLRLPLFLCMVGLILCGCGRKEEKIFTRVVIETTPEQGASVLIDGVERGLTPCTVEGLPPGWTDVLLKRDGYKRKADRIEVKPNQEVRFVIELDPLVGYVTIESTPAGAEVILDGEQTLGKTPLARVPLRIGPHKLDIRLENYYPESQEITVEEDFQYSFNYPLKPREGKLTVFSQPTNAELYLNNVLQPQKTPAILTLSPGTYLVSVHSRGYVQKEEKINLGPNQEVSVTLKMDPGSVPPGMVLIPAGEFWMGADGVSPDESPRRKIYVEAFYIDKTEVTNAQFKAVFPNHTYPKGQDDFPVTGVSWEEATSYASKVGKRLPTEAEWEKAARGEDGREWPWGNEFNKALCNTQESNLDQVTKVGQYLGGVSPYGCFDMAGNVYEWTADWYEAYPGNKLVTKDYGQIYRVLRGGSYMTSRFHARCARRHFDRMDAKRADYGFRCAKDVPTDIR